LAGIHRPGVALLDLHRHGETGTLWTVARTALLPGCAKRQIRFHDALSFCKVAGL